MRIASIFAAFLVLTACGGGGGGGGTTVAVPTGATHSIEFPLGTVQVRKTAGQLTAGSTATLRLTVPDPQPVAVTACIGGDWASATAFSAVAEGAGIWQATVVCPDPLPAAAAVLMRLTMPDGEVYESGAADAPAAVF